MLYPGLKRIREKVSKTDVFAGIKASGRISEGKFRDMSDISFDEFPCMSTRNKRAVWTGYTDRYSGENAFHNGSHVFPGKGILAASSVADKFCYCSESSLFINGKKIASDCLDPEALQHSIVGFGRNLFILPEGLYVKTLNESKFEVTDMRAEKSFFCTAVVFCDASDTEIDAVNIYTYPSEAVAGDKIIQRESDEMYLYVFSEEGNWERDKKLYAKIKANGIEESFHQGEKLSFSEDFFLVKNGTVISSGEGYITVDTVIAGKREGDNYFTVRKRMPVMDFAVEHNNRIWGCRYGEDIDGNFVNEVYACALGDPLTWYCFEGTSMDSFTAGLGCSGEFTGAVVYENDVLFFKEDYMIRIRGDSPSSFNVQTVPFLGVEKGSSRSTVIIGERLFYKSRDGIYVYDGAVPVNISKALGNQVFSDVTAGTVNGKYYAAMTDKKGRRSIYVFDSGFSLWSKESCKDVRYIINHGGCLFFIEFNGILDGGGRAYSFLLWDSRFCDTAPDILSSFDKRTDYEYVSEDSVSWFFESGDMGDSTLPDRQILRSLLITAVLKKDAYMDVFIMPEGEKEYMRLCTVSSPHEGAFCVPVNTPPCHSYKMKIEGKGECIIHSVVRRSEITGEVRNVGRK